VIIGELPAAARDDHHHEIIGWPSDRKLNALSATARFDVTPMFRFTIRDVLWLISC
jgi:hypothetical protein